MHIPPHFGVVTPYIIVEDADSYVEEADHAMQTALLHGGVKIMDVANMPYGDRQAGIKDPAGNIWWISQRLLDTPYF
jgi:PhnB protein